MKRLNPITLILLLLFSSCNNEYILHDSGNGIFLTEIKGDPYQAGESSRVTIKRPNEYFQIFKMNNGGIYKAVAIQKSQGRPITNYNKLVIKGPKINGKIGNGEITRTIS